MARDLSIEVKEFVVSSLAAAAPVAALTAERVYGPSVPQNPGWPFIRTDLPVVAPSHDEGCGGNNSRYTFRVHGFAKGDDEQQRGCLGAAIAAAVDELSGVIAPSPEAAITDTVWTGTQVFRDIAEVNGWHAMVSVYCRVSG